MPLPARSRRLLLAVAVALALALVAYFLVSDDEPTTAAAGEARSTPTAPRDAELVAPPAIPREDDQERSADATPPREGLGALEPAAGPTTPAGTPAAVALRGRVVDAATGDPVADVRIVGAESGAEAFADGAGRFAGDEPVTTDETLRVFDPYQGTHVRDVPAEARVVEPGGELLLRIAIGPTTAIRLPADATGPASRWQARLVLERADGVVDEHGWQRVHGEDLDGWFRYDNPLVTDGPAPTRVLVQARDEDETTLAEGEGDGVVGVLRRRVPLIVVERHGALRGRVVDQDGEPLDELDVYAAPRTAGVTEGAEPRRAGTDDDGSFALGGLAPGPWRLFLRHPLRAGAEPLDVDVAPGTTDLGDLTVEVPAPAGDVRGVLRGPAGTLPSYVHVHLSALDGGLEQLDTASRGGPLGYGWSVSGEHAEAADGPAELPFQFRDLPAGRYRVEVLDPEGARWGDAVVVEPPREDLVFTRLADDARRPLRLDVFDAEDGSPLDAVTVRVERGGRELTTRTVAAGREALEVTPSGAVKLFVWADDYELAEVPAAALRPDGDGLRARVELRRGWSARLEFLDCEGRLDVLDARGTDLWLARARHPPVAGARVLVGGEAVATTGADGVAHLRLAERPRDVDLDVPGHRVLGSVQVERGLWQGDDRFGVVWVYVP